MCETGHCFFVLKTILFDELKWTKLFVLEEKKATYLRKMMKKIFFAGEMYAVNNLKNTKTHCCEIPLINFWQKVLQIVLFVICHQFLKIFDNAPSRFNIAQRFVRLAFF